MRNESNCSRWHLLPLIAICLVALGLRYWGIDWPHLHPDEAKIASWVTTRDTHNHLIGKFYAEGFFSLLAPVRTVQAWIKGVQIRWEYFKGDFDRLELPQGENVSYVRRVNAWLSVISVAVLYLLILSVTKSRGAGLFGAAWLALAPLHIENSHYAETDIAAVFMLTISLGAWVWVLKRGGVCRLGLAAVVTGFAIGTKFTLLPLLPCALVVPWVPHADERVGMRSRLLRTTAVVFACLVGLLMADPGFADWKWFYPKMASGVGSVYAERNGLFGSATGRWMPVLANLRELRMGLGMLGWLWLGLVTLGGIAAFRRIYRPFWPVVFLFPFAYLLYFVFVAPWVRGQEFMIFFPSFALWAGVGILSLTQLLESAPVRPVLRRGIPALLVVYVLGDVAIAGLRRASLFAWPDSRVEAREWFRIHAPPDRIIGFGSYVDPAFRVSALQTVDVGPVERVATEKIRQEGIAYVIRNPVSHGRGTINPATGQRFREFDGNWETFVRESQQLWKWTTLDVPSFHFACMPIEYWGLIHAQPTLSMDLPFPQPAYLKTSAREGMWPMTLPLGSVKDVEVSRYPRNLVIGGPAERDRPLYMLLQTFDRGAIVRIDGMDCFERVAMSPYSVEALTLRRSKWLPRLSAYDILTVQAEPEKFITFIPCRAEILLDESMVACRLLQKGYPDKALAFLKQAVPGGDWPDKMVWPAFAAATAQGDWALADLLHSRAAALLQKLRDAETVSSRSLAINGVGGVYYDDHSRMRLEPIALTLEADAEARKNLVIRVVLPVRLARGDYELTFNARLQRGETNGLPVTVRVTDDKTEYAGAITGVRAPISLPVRVTENEKELCLSVTATDPCEIVLDDIELRWRLGDMMTAVARELCRALARYDLHSLETGSEGTTTAANAIAERAARFPDDVELMRLQLAAAVRAGLATQEIAAVASRIVARAPDHAAARAILGRSTSEKKDEMTSDFEFYPFFRLTGVAYRESEHILRCRFVVLRDDAPTPALTLWRHPAWHRGWRKATDRVLSERPALFQGEEYVADIPLPEGARPPFKDFALSVSTRPRWHPRDYAIVGREDSKLPLRTWFSKP